MDKIEILGLSVLTKIGVHPWEQRILQALSIDIQISTDISNCNDKIENTIDYDKVCQEVSAYLESSSFTLIETVANNLAELIKTKFNVPAITISVSKPNAILSAANVRVTVSR